MICYIIFFNGIYRSNYGSSLTDKARVEINEVKENHALLAIQLCTGKSCFFYQSIHFTPHSEDDPRQRN